MQLTHQSVLPPPNNSFPLKSYSIEWPFIDLPPFNNRYWDFGGDTVVDINSQTISLTREIPNQAGWLWSRQQLASNAWSIDIDFVVHGRSGYFHGDGFAFWYTKTKQQSGPVFGNQDHTEGLGVFFDTFKNGKHDFLFPYVTVQLGDGVKGYDFKTDGKSGEAGGCPAYDFRNRDWRTVARVEYLAGESLKVFLNVKGENKWELCTQISGVTLPSFGYLGFTAHTGAAFDNHNILRVTTSGMPHTPPGSSKDSAAAASSKDSRKIRKDSGTSTRNGSFSGERGFLEGFGMWVVGVFGVCVVGVAGLVAWKRVKVQTPKSYQKRF
ncbi:hypothetical protein BCR33DRAFT_723408 [Rhizoclosmatium globosum]|uniref:L-type lectin-like domain-containing protein n=1 Tax=Rhizoclosmatium globosum TaxID=329046 RepID=A0A1Y2BD38_9FUNG|nr:hypothetical protein BCR33DRAFT_723408 [Rhizoclosmatium globosum]|eukprot:ORY32752.1 hypothetical protein BCR33DRAFT_723408 [Rhizoclosmatium globosum]